MQHASADVKMHSDRGVLRTSAPIQEITACDGAPCHGTVGAVIYPPLRVLRGHATKAQKTATKTQMHFQQKRKCKIDKTQLRNL